MNRSKGSRVRVYHIAIIGLVVVCAAAIATGWARVAADKLAAAFDQMAPGTVRYERDATTTAPTEVVSADPQKPKVAHVAIPQPLYAIYMTQCAVGTASLRDKLVALLEGSELNAVVIDIKDYSGTIAFRPESEELLPIWNAAKCGANDMKEFVASLHEKGIYVIGRITVFQDPYMTKLHPERSVQSKARPGQPWKDNKGLSFIAVNSTEHWSYIVALSKESYEIGFDELNYDYIRWPSDGPMDDIVYPSKDRAGELEKFFAFLNKEVKAFDTSHHGGHELVMSADLFGYTTVLTDDLGIGQQLERALPYFDFIAPMVYPSHYNKGFNGIADPNKNPYGVVYASMSEAARRAQASETAVSTLDGAPVMREEVVPAHRDESGAFVATSTKQVASGLYTKPVFDALKLRPWLQDFDYPVPYTPEMVAAQIKANEDSGLDSYMFWDPANRYDSLRQVLKSE